MSAPPIQPSENFRLEINGEMRVVSGPCTVAELLSELSLAGKRVAVAVNREVVFRGKYTEAQLTEGDQVEILEAVGGG